MNVIKSKIIKSIKNKKLNVFVFFFLLAFFFLIIVKLSNSYTETVQLRVVIKNLPQEHKVFVDSNQTIAVKIKAHGFKLLSLSVFKPRLVIDFKTDIVLNNNSYVWSSNHSMQNIVTALGNVSEIVLVQPDSLVFSFETMTVKKIPVIFNSDIKMLPGYDISGDIAVSPDSVIVVGSSRHVSEINDISTRILKLKDVHSDFKYVIGIHPSENLRQLDLSHEHVEISAKVEKYTEGIFDIPVTVTNLPDTLRISVFPKTISVAYYVSLENYKYIKPSGFKIECDYNTILNTEQTFLIPELVQYPEQVKRTRLKNSKVEFILIR